MWVTNTGPGDVFDPIMLTPYMCYSIQIGSLKHCICINVYINESPENEERGEIAQLSTLLWVRSEVWEHVGERQRVRPMW